MKSSFFKSLNKKTILGGGILCIVFSLLFASCDSFLKADDIRDEIEKVIDYNNAQKVPVLIRADEGTGSFLVEGEKEFTVNFTEVELQFTANTKAIVFKGLEAVSKTNHSISRNDCVELTKISGNVETGVYTYTLKITQKVNDILIKPVYQLRPAVVDISPLYTNLPTDPIVITFNVPVEEKNVKPNNSVLNFTNISIKCNNADITNCFNTPTLNEDKTILTITPNSTAFNTLLHSYNSSSYIDIAVSLDPRTIFEIDGNYLKYAENNTLDFILHYSTDFEFVSPTKKSFQIYKNWNTNTNTGSEPFRKLTISNFLDDYDDWNVYGTQVTIPESYFVQNITGDTIYIYGKYNDAQSGIKTILVEEYYDKKINESDESTTFINEYTKNSEEVILWNRYSNGDIVFCIEKKLLSEDGVISLRTTVKDAFGNSATQEELSIIKSTSIRLGYTVLQNLYCSEMYGSSPKPFNMSTYETDLRDIHFIYYYEKDYDHDYDDITYEDNNFYAYYAYRPIDPEIVFTSIKCQYYNDANELVTESMQPEYLTGDHEGATKWHYYIDSEDVEDLNNLTVRIIIEDIVGNSTHFDFTFPGKTELVSDTKTNDKRKLKILQTSESTSNSGLIVFKKNSNWQAIDYYGTEFDVALTDIPDGTEFYIVSADTYSLTSQLNEKYIAGSKTTGTHPIEYEKISYEKTDDDSILIDIKIKQDSLNYFDSISARFGYASDSYLGRYYLSKGEKSIKIKQRTLNLYASDYILILYGIKDGICSESEPIPIPKFTDPKYDNVNPVIETDFHIKFPEYYYFKTVDKQSGISRIYFNDMLVEIPENTDGNTYYYILDINNGKISVDSIMDNSVAGTTLANIILIHLYDVIDESLGVPILNFEVKAYDKANNCTTKKVNEIITKGSPLYVFSKNGYTWTFTTKVNQSTFAFGLSKFDNQKWNFAGYNVSTNTPKYAYSLSNCKNKFIRVSNKFSTQQYYYVSTNLNTGDYDCISLQNPSCITVSSDAPVFVQTIVSSRSYSVCKEWTKEDWLFAKRIIGEQQINLNSSNKSQDYYIPINEIKTDESYVVIVYFADGSSVMSDVMIKQ